MPLALALLAPVVVNIVGFQAFLAPSGLLVPFLCLALEVFLAYAYRGAFAPMLQAKTAPAGGEEIAASAGLTVRSARVARKRRPRETRSLGAEVPRRGPVRERLTDARCLALTARAFLGAVGPGEDERAARGRSQAAREPTVFREPFALGVVQRFARLHRERDYRLAAAGGPTMASSFSWSAMRSTRFST